MMKLSFSLAPIVVLFAACAAQEEVPPTSSDGRRLVEAYVAAWNKHDSTALDTLLAADGVHEDIAQDFRGGAAQTKDFMRGLIAVEPDFKWTLTDVFDAGSHVAAEWTWTATYTGDSPAGPVVAYPTSGRGSSIAEIENGRIKRFTDYYDVASFFRRAQQDTGAVKR